MEVGIVGSAADLHSEVVRWALTESGVNCHLFDTLRGLQEHPGLGLEVEYGARSGGGIVNGNLRALWYRRHYKVRSHVNDPNDENDAFRTAERNVFQDNIVDTLAIDPRIGWINNPRNARAAENKFGQLLFAQRAGLAIPDTLMTTAPDQIRDFARRHDTVVVKPFGVFAWRYADHRARYALASKIEASRVLTSSDAALSNTPAIYQTVVSKKSDLRVVIIGTQVHAYNITQTGEPDFDSRFSMSDPTKSSIEAYNLSLRQKTQILDMMAKLGIEMASADFGLTHEDEIVFLDLNPAGAWLFLEERVPEIELTAQTCRLLVNKAGLAVDGPFPNYDAFNRSGALERFNARCHADARAGITFLNDRTWREAPQERSSRLEASVAGSAADKLTQDA